MDRMPHLAPPERGSLHHLLQVRLFRQHASQAYISLQPYLIVAWSYILAGIAVLLILALAVYYMRRRPVDSVVSCPVCSAQYDKKKSRICYKCGAGSV